MNKFKTIYKIITTREAIAIILLITLLVVGPIYGAYKDGYFYKNSDNPSHVLIRLLNERAKYLYSNSYKQNRYDIAAVIEDIVKVGDNINNIIALISEAGFEYSEIDIALFPYLDKTDTAYNSASVIQVIIPVMHFPIPLTKSNYYLYFVIDNNGNIKDIWGWLKPPVFL